MTAPYPPQKTHHTHPLPVSTALSLLQTYLHATETQPCLHPDAVQSESGPQFARTAAGGLTLHNLRRVEAGLRGERLGTDLSLAELSAETGVDYGGGGDVDEGVREEDDDGEWQDMDDFKRQQSVDEGEVEKRDNIVGDGGQVPRLLEGDGRLDRHVRKREKKERRKSERRERNERRREGVES